MTPKTSITYPLNPEQQKSLAELLRSGNYRPVDVEHALCAGETPDVRVVLYKSGKCVVQGKGTEDFVRFILEPCVLMQATLDYERETNPDAFKPRIGVDESGKGDFFGPMVIAGAYADESLVEAMQTLGVKDSKQITSDKKAMELARELRTLLGRRISLIRIGPEKYNQLHTRMGSVNRLLSWGHATVIENMLEVVPDCPRAISDQFGAKEQVIRALKQRGRGIELIQRHRAESDLAVAAASILARDGFLQGIQELSRLTGIQIPKGASAAVRAAAVEVARKHGPAILLKTVKCHFRTTDQVLAELGVTREQAGLPPRREDPDPDRWKRHRSSSSA